MLTNLDILVKYPIVQDLLRSKFTDHNIEFFINNLKFFLKDASFRKKFNFLKKNYTKKEFNSIVREIINSQIMDSSIGALLDIQQLNILQGLDLNSALRETESLINSSNLVERQFGSLRRLILEGKLTVKDYLKKSIDGRMAQKGDSRIAINESYIESISLDKMISDLIKLGVIQLKTWDYRLDRNILPVLYAINMINFGLNEEIAISGSYYISDPFGTVSHKKLITRGSCSGHLRFLKIKAMYEFYPELGNLLFLSPINSNNLPGSNIYHKAFTEAGKKGYFKVISDRRKDGIYLHVDYKKFPEIEKYGGHGKFIDKKTFEIASKRACNEIFKAWKKIIEIVNEINTKNNRKDLLIDIELAKIIADYEKTKTDYY